jgi:uncharacterized membrane protein
MKALTKKKFKEQLKKKLPWIIGSGVFLVSGVVLLIVGFSLTGWNFIKWLEGPYATTTIILLVLGLASAIILTLVIVQVKLLGDTKDE